MTSARKIIEKLRCGETVLNVVGRYIGEESLPYWSNEEVHEMTSAAIENINLESLSLYPDILDAHAVTPFQAILENTLTLQRLDLTSGLYCEDPAVEFQICARIDMLYEAALNNRYLPLKYLHIEGFTGRVSELFKSFLGALPMIEVLDLRRGMPLHGFLPADYANALAASLPGMYSLKTIDFFFACDDPASLVMIIESLHGHPSLEKFELRTSQLDNASLNAVLALCFSCPKIRQVQLYVDGHGASGISQSFRAVTPLTNMGCPLQTLFFDRMRFDEESLGKLVSNSSSLKTVTFKDCVGVSAGVGRCIGGLQEPYEVKVECGLLVDEEGRLNESLSDVTNIVASSPPSFTLEFTREAASFQCAVSIVATGLQSRQAPLKRLALHCHSWRRGTLGLVSIGILPLIADGIEELSLGYELEDGEELQNFFCGLSKLVNLKTLNCSCQIRSNTTANNLLKFLEKNRTIIQCEGVRFYTAGNNNLVDDIEDQVQFYMNLNRCGRRLLHVHNPDDDGDDDDLGIWPTVLANTGPAGNDPNIMYELLKILCGEKNLFTR